MGIKEKMIYLGEMGERRSTITLRNGTELLVENCRGVSSFDDNFITLSVYGLQVTISGTPLMFESFGVDGVRITGKIHSLTLEEIPT